MKHHRVYINGPQSKNNEKQKRLSECIFLNKKFNVEGVNVTLKSFNI